MYYINADKIKINNNEIFLELNNIGYKGVCFDKQINDKKFFLYALRSDFAEINYFSTDEKLVNLIKYLHKISGIGETIVKQLLLNFNFEEIQNVVKAYDINTIMEKTGIKISAVELILEELNKYFFNIKKTSTDKKVINTLKKLGYQIHQIYRAMQEVDKTISMDEYIKNIIINIALNEAQ